LAEREKERRTPGESKKLLTGIGLLMEGISTRFSRQVMMDPIV
jgi:hypothetical protein